MEKVKKRTYKKAECSFLVILFLLSILVTFVGPVNAHINPGDTDGDTDGSWGDDINELPDLGKPSHDDTTPFDGEVNTVGSGTGLDAESEEGEGEEIDPDSDEDGIPDSSDICPGHDDNEDSDGDGIPNGCDETPYGDPIGGDEEPDSDEDGIPDNEDNCPYTYNPEQEDTDGDGIGDTCDDTPNGDPIGGDEEPDSDEDGIPDNEDNCPYTYNPEQEEIEDEPIEEAPSEEEIIEILPTDLGNNFVYKVELKPKEYAELVIFEEKILDSAPNEIYLSPAGDDENKIVAVYLDLKLYITEHYIQESDIESLTFYYRVKKDVLDENRIEKESVLLMRYNDGIWKEPLDNRYLYDDGEYAFFAADHEGCSTFAIVGSKVVEKEEAFKTNEPDIPWIFIFMFVIIGMVVLIFVLLKAHFIYAKGYD